ncbi:MAG: FHA domain-containing protein [Lachnospiraceae bacterium]|nr:FHA domain-containing protein [Lachnospiraceae bacterium]
MKITALVCNSSHVLEGVIRDGETEELRAEKEYFRLREDFGLQIYNNGESAELFYSQELCGKAPSGICSDARLPIRTRSGESLILLLYFSKEEESLFGLYRLTEQAELSVGRAENAVIRTPGLPFISLNHLRILKENGIWCLEVCGENGCYVNLKHLAKHKKHALFFGDEVILYGLKLTWLKDYLAVISYSDGQGERVLSFKEDGACAVREVDLCKPEREWKEIPKEEFRSVNPIPRTIKRLDLSPVKLDAPPHKQSHREESLFLTIGPAFSMAIPMVLGSGLAIYGNKQNGASGGAFLYTGLITAVSAAVLGGVWAVLNLKKRRMDERKNERRRRKAYGRYMKEMEDSVFRTFSRNREVLFYMNPSIAKLSEGIQLSYLWNRAVTDEDFLSVRLGIGTYPGPAMNIEIPREGFRLESDQMQELPAKLNEKYGTLKEVPIPVDLRSERLFGMISEDGLLRLSLLFLLVLQLSYFISSAQLLLAFLFCGDTLPENGLFLLRFLPQVRTDDCCFLACGEEVTEKKKELLEQVRAERQTGCVRETVVFSDDYSAVRELLSEDESIRLVLVKKSYEELPKDCRVIFQNDPEFAGVLHTRDSSENRSLTFDTVSGEEAERIIRRLSGLGPSFERARAGIPQKVFLEQILGIPVSQLYEQILKNWAENDTLTELRIPIGVGKDGQICYLDPHENAHGPHGLVAGMTGSGKSEMLQTLILSLMIRFSPDKAAFFLIDYKGGGMAELFKDLPHICGSISNLSGSLIYRAMVSIRSENERRQRIFLQAGVNNIREYEKKHIAGEALEPLPHIFIIIDEFAELKKNEPDFMRELVSVAQVGRSLGIHLILATQKPQGTVDDKIQSNTRFRICLRVQDKQDSFDMLKKPDAAFLTGVGRAFLQVGNDEIYEEFQSAYTMAVSGRRRKEENIFLMTKQGRRELKPPGELSEPLPETEEEGIRDFYLVRGFLTAAAKERKVQPAKQLWTRELPESFVLNISDKTDKYTYPVGLFDAPRRQVQGTFFLDLNQSGHIAILGRSGSGKSTLLQSLLYAFLMKDTPETMAVYLLDFGNSALRVFDRSSLSGAYLTEEDGDRIENLFIMLKKELGRRKKEYGGISFSIRQEIDPKGLFRIVLIIDNFGAFRARTKEKYDEVIRELLKNGEAYGLTLILSAGQISPSDLPARVHETVKTVICLAFSDRMQYAQAFRLVRNEIYPDERVRGRGLAFVGTELLEFQAGLPCPGNDYERQLYLQEAIDERNREYQGKSVRPVPFIPKHADLRDLVKAAEGEGFSFLEDTRVLPAGFQVKGGEVWYPELKGGCFLVSGRKKSGKTNLLRILVTMAKRCKIEVSEPETVEELAKLLGQAQDWRRLIILRDTGGILSRFYEKGYDMKLEAELIGRLEENRENGKDTIVAECAVEDTVSLSGRRIFETMKQEAEGVHLGGMISAQNFFDFPEVSFTQKSQSKKAGEGDVPCLSEERFYGEVRIPIWAEMSDT